MSDTTTTTRTITLTDRPPVTIDEAAWPLIATAKWWDNTYESQANRTASVRVREHEDGRRIVYGVSDFHHLFRLSSFLQKSTGPNAFRLTHPERSVILSLSGAGITPAQR